MQYTEEQQKDFEERAKSFGEGLDALSKEFQVEIVNSVVTVPNQSGVFGLTVASQIGDLKYKPIPSPLNDELSPKTS